MGGGGEGAYLIFVIFLHSHIFRPENFTLKSVKLHTMYVNLHIVFKIKYFFVNYTVSVKLHSVCKII